MELSEGQNVLKSLDKYFTVMEPGAKIQPVDVECCATCEHFKLEYENPPKEKIDNETNVPIIYNNCVNPEFKKAFFTLGYFKCTAYKDMRKRPQKSKVEHKEEQEQNVPKRHYIKITNDTPNTEDSELL